jgi:hypothetical protein
MSKSYEVGVATPIMERGKAILFDIDGVGREFIPTKGIHDDSEVWKEGQESGILVVDEWVAEMKGWL